jgi:hypothetical protein
VPGPYANSRPATIDDAYQLIDANSWDAYREQTEADEERCLQHILQHPMRIELERMEVAGPARSLTGSAQPPAPSGSWWKQWAEQVTRRRSLPKPQSRTLAALAFGWWMVG